MIKEDEPQRQPAARIQPQVPAVSINCEQQEFWQQPANDRSRPK
jgi:hypothetical protein